MGAICFEPQVRLGVPSRTACARPQRNLCRANERGKVIEHGDAGGRRPGGARSGRLCVRGRHSKWRIRPALPTLEREKPGRPVLVTGGPSLADVYDKQAASMKGYAYSPALTNAHLTWTAAALNKFLTSPQTDVPGTKMPFAGLSDPGQRADVIAYLTQLAQAQK